MRIAAIILALSLSSIAAANGHSVESLRPVTHEDVWTMRRLGTPVTSPDGKWAIVAVAEPAYKEEETVSDLWLVAVDGKTEPRRLTATKDAEDGVEWSPDGTRIAFSAKRGEAASQLYVMDMTMPGEAQKITSLATGASGPKWSPDGRRIAFESRVYPGTLTAEENAAEKKAREERDYNATAYEIFPIRQWNRWRDDLQTHVFVQDAVPGAEARDLLAGTDFVARPGFAGVPRLAGESLKPEWTPDGRALVISATQNLDAAGDFVSDPDVFTADFDRSVADMSMSPDGRTIYFTAMDEGRVRLFDVPASGKGTVTALDRDSGGVYAGPQPAGRVLVARWEDATNPAELVRVDTGNGRHENLTAFNTERAAALDRPPFREFWFESSLGRRIHSFVALPPGFDESETYPVITLIHGGPHSSSLDADHVRWSPHLIAAAGYVVVMTDYTGSVGYGLDFSRAIQGDPLKTPGDELNEALDEAIRIYPFIDADRQAAAGASYGGHLINWLQGTTTRFRTLVGHAGLVDLPAA